MPHSIMLSVYLRNDLKGYPAESFADGQPIMVRGVTVLDDIAPENWTYDSSSTATDDDVTVIKPYDLTNLQAGRFIKKWVYNIADPVRIINNNPARSHVTSFDSANGFQVSANRYANVSYSVEIVCNIQIGVAANVEGTAVLEICPTNSPIGTNWKAISTVTNGQNAGLALALSLSQKTCIPVSGTVPPGWYARVRAINVQGTPVFALRSQQEVII